MFDIGMTEMLVIAVVAIIVVGPKDLPGMLRNVAKYVGQIRGMARDFKGQMDSALKEAELDGVKNTLDDIRNMNPINDIKSEVSNYMDSARALDVPDDDEPFPVAEAFDSGVPDEVPDEVTEKVAKPALKKPAAKKTAPKTAQNENKAKATTTTAAAKSAPKKRAAPRKKTAASTTKKTAAGASKA